MISDEKTIEYYNEHASVFAEGTIDVAFSEIQDRFLAYLPEGAKILDFGCGSGRDTKYFLSKGYRVDATDGSEKICEIAGHNTGIPVKKMLFTELDADSCYDGIWACASILHLPKSELKDVLIRMLRAVKPGGYIYTSFKYGDFEGIRDGRHFTDFTEEAFRTFARDIPGLEIVDVRISADVRPGRSERWLNLILKRAT